ncbi:hypothetical protein [Paraburkholderia sp.]|jgi:predicted MFS family arabinose efflux permease|uniref:hypothetical protein n=1 Tax=Paraburkholderia sp. TaxID=1926495 RepID=UPI002F3E8B36
MALAVGVGAALSHVTGDYVVEKFGFASGFLTLAVISGFALVFFAVFMPKTRPDDDSETAPGARPSELAATPD